MSGSHAHGCPHDEVLTGLIDSSVDPRQRTELLSHLQTCESCRSRFRALAAGQFPQFDNYTVVERIGRGGFGVVYRAVHHAKQRTEALKVLFARTPLHTAYFENEVHLIASLRHPCIATLYEAQLSTPPMYYTMEFVEGRRLNEYLRCGSVGLPERIRIIRAVAEAIGYAHEQGVLHRDIKPQNILIDEAGQPRIVDFGIGRRLGLPEASQELEAGSEAAGEGPIGTLGYIAPEQAQRRSVDARADIYALGVLLFHCVTGRPATQAAHRERLPALLAQQRIRRARDLAAIIARCVAPEPQQRYASCNELIADLDAYLEGRWVTARVERWPLRRALRLAGYVLRQHHNAVQLALLIAVIAALSYSFATVRTRALGGPGLVPHSVLVSLDESTWQAVRSGELAARLPGLDPQQPKSLRLLHARVLERLALAQPRVVVLDFYFPDCQPEYDPALISAMRNSPAPVVVGVSRFDVNGEPVMCRELGEAAHSFGALVTRAPGQVASELEVTAGIQRGYEPPIPGLALAAFGAARTPAGRLRLSVQNQILHLRYGKRSAAPGEPRWFEHSDEVPLFARPAAAPDAELLQPGDRVLTVRVPGPLWADWSDRMHSYLEVLAAEPEQLRAWFDGRAVVLGQMIPGEDQHRLADGRLVYGMQAQAHMLDALLSGVRVANMSRGGLLTRIAMYCLLAAILVRRVPIDARRRLSAYLVGCGVCLAAALWIAELSTRSALRPPALELAIAAVSVLAATAVLGAARSVREFAGRMAPPAAAPSEQRSTLPSTVLQPASGSTTTARR